MHCTQHWIYTIAGSLQVDSIVAICYLHYRGKDLRLLYLLMPPPSVCSNFKREVIMIPFEYLEDQKYYEDLLLHETHNNINNFASMFDFRPPEIKRKEFNKNRKRILEALRQKHGMNCMLKFDCCDIHSGITVDHLIPISSNKLNKELRNLKPEKGKKVKTQSFGSNHLDNLIIACSNCNNHKKHRILDHEKMAFILKEKRK